MATPLVTKTMNAQKWQSLEFAWRARNLPDTPGNLPDTPENLPDTPENLPDNPVSRPSARTPPSTRAGGQDDVSSNKLPQIKVAAHATY